METRKSPDISERTNSGCSAEAVYAGNFSVTVADDGETALVVSIVKGDERFMKLNDNIPSSVQVNMDRDPESSHLEICCKKENTEHVPEKSDISSGLPSDSNQPLFAVHMENRSGISIEQVNLVVIQFSLRLSCNFLTCIDSQYALPLVSAG